MDTRRSCGCLFLLIVTCLVTLCIDLTGARRYRSCEEGCCIHEYCAYHRICYPKIHCRFGCPDGTCVGGEDQANSNTKNRPFSSGSSLSPTFSSVGLKALTTSEFSRNEFSTGVKKTSNRDSPSTLTQTQSKPATAPLEIPVSKGRYVNQNNEITPPGRFSVSPGAHNQIFTHALGRQEGVSKGDSRKLTPGRDLKANPRQSGLFSSIAKDIARDLPGNSGICMPAPPCKPKDDCGMGNVCAFNYNLGYSTCQYNLEIGSTLCYDKNGELNLQPTSS
ncbi:hypothetical protein ElyMa_001811700 [Elysia marginata]|uniref:EGF-like domain-containing protein n=1 Tax=Elysia marginata TaxID=1093978 RepID=A0AAV4EH21_9GAST|nr:hypothetical protein ElyMa_001811700 [Elysia marginata]